ncbi:site-specific integrase [Alkalihalophilus lindianensis]|uniref:Site-specific integrase n=1 Tax=Alkalihalophilus lindianensis TaxID=1630542 RepID=A0ABU3XGT9_9BACI|nr:site-specific integrase [Alkalihalophilus lindianensis]MDV2686624.1 site-specific integrase [Alkalihalophilus lindianensis]
MKYLEKEELNLFLEAAREHGIENDYFTFITLAYTGMRAGELCALKWSDINFEDQTVSITKTLYNPTNNLPKYKLLPPKTKRSKRTIHLDGFVLEELKKLKGIQNQVKMAHRDGFYDGDFIFTNYKKHLGYPEIIKTIERRMKSLLKKVELNSKLTPHSLRHTHTSLLAEAGVSLEGIMDRLGHADDKTTKLVYMHVTKTIRKEASEKFSDLMKSVWSQ